MRWRFVAAAMCAWMLGCEPEPGDGGVAEPSSVADSTESNPAQADPKTASAPESDGEPAAKQPAPKPVQIPQPSAAGTCPEKDNPAMGVMVLPHVPVAGEEVTVVAATLELEAALALRVEVDGQPIDAKLEHRPGVPSAVIARFVAPEQARVIVGIDDEGWACMTVRAKGKARRRPRALSDQGVWPAKRKWDAGEEALFSAWVREMFTAPRGEELAWKRLDEVTSDPSRNLLHNAYGWSEDDPDPSVGLRMKPDCADAPYFLRGYFAWKRELPFAFRKCSRGRGEAPRCGGLHASVGPPEHDADTRKPGELGALQKYMRRTLAWGVHSGNGRTAHTDDATDFYPVKLERGPLRPGTTYADPYGHLFVLVEWKAARGDEPGILYAIDGQPDGSITRKRFWEGNFLWNQDPSLGGSGFKNFRPHKVVKDGEVLAIEVPDNEALRKLSGYQDYSEGQGKLSPNAFYDRMDALITPGHRDAFAAQEAAVQALLEAAKVRVTSVKNGDGHVAKGGMVDMPDGHAIFETTGAWENFSTPARDLRLLIAIDVVRGFADKVKRNPDIYLDGDQSLDDLLAELEKARAKLLADPSATLTYTRSNGSEWSLSVGDVVERAEAFEVGYNPNDCPELRWGAPKGSEERKTCRRRAPALQQRKMDAYRPWFAERRRPPRGDPGPPVQ